MAYNPKVSVVDYMNSKKMNSSFSNRSKLAAQYGIKGYQGTADQNSKLLQYMSAPKPKPTSTKAPSNMAPRNRTVVTGGGKPSSSSTSKNNYEAQKKKDLAFYNQYNTALKTGTNNTAQYKQYQAIVNKYKLKAGTVDQSVMRNLSIQALNGDSKAAAYLKAMNMKGLTGKSLWDGYDLNQLQKNTGAHKQYLKDNPYSQYTKDYETWKYGIYNSMIEGKKGLTDGQLKYYQTLAEKYNLDNLTDPLVRNRLDLEKDEQEALNAQDVALNQGLLTQDRNNFQSFQQLQQEMANRGITGSGMAGDAMLRAQMGANANYQQAFSDSAQAKTDIRAAYQDQINNARSAIVENQNEQKAAGQQVQQKQDEFLTTTTGYVYMNGKRLTLNGKPVSTLEMQKLTEQQRHNMAVENNTSVKNLLDYKAKIDANNAKREGDKLDFSQGMDANAVKRAQIAANLQQALAKIKVDYAKIDLDWAKLESNNKIAQDKISIAAENAQTSKDKAQITALGKQLSSLTSQITAYQKKGKKPPKSIVDKYNSVNNQLNSLISGGNF